MTLSVQHPEISDASGAIMPAIAGSAFAASMAIQQTAQRDLEIAGTVPLSVVSAGVVGAALAVDGIDQLSRIEIADQVYLSAISSSSLEVGEFTYDPISRQVQVKLLDEQQDLTGQSEITARAYGLADSYQAGTPKPQWIETLPALFIKWNVSGTIRVRRAFRQAATCSFGFTTLASQRSAVLSDWKNKQTAWEIGGQRFRQVSITINRAARSRQPRGELFVTIEGESAHLEPLSDQIPFSVPAGSSIRSTTLAALCGSAGVPYVGPLIKVPVPDELTNRTRTTALEWAEQRDRSVGGYRYFSNAEAFEVRLWQSPREHMIALADIMSDPPSIVYNGDGAEVDEIPLAAEWSNRTLEADEDSSGEINRDVYRTVYSAAREDRPVSFTPQRKSEIRDLNLSWPNSPPAWEQWDTTLNKMLLQIRRREYGWLFDAFDVYSVDAVFDVSSAIERWQDQYKGDINPLFRVSDYWRICKEENTRFFYGDEGYRVRAVTSGWEYARFLGDDLLALRKQFAEAIGDNEERYRLALRILLSGYVKPTLQLDDQARAIALSDTRIWNLADISGGLPKTFKRRINRVTTYTLDELRRWFPDTPAPADDEPEARFVTRTSVSEVSRETYRNPDSTPSEVLPQIASGKDFTSTKRLTFIRPSRVGDVPPADFERFKEVETIRSSEGPVFQKEARQESASYSDGRPSAQERLIRYGNGGDLPDELTDEESLTLETLVSTPGQGLTVNDPSDGTLRFDGVSDEGEMIALATIEARIENTESSSPATISILPARYDIHEGDRVFVEGVAYRVFEIDEPTDIVRPIGDGRVLCSAPQGWSLTIGREFGFELDVLRREN